ncbi:hypothetical protein [Herbidospora mongoliensis]|uniref:hypothetical protein n=1 Tax=Herbidospora mongoliensis TaxID=688067 RepID=UPI000833D4CE|nr:hypothetical protein [Herbidospora mongoliensis]
MLQRCGIGEELSADGKKVTHVVWTDMTTNPIRRNWTSQFATWFPDLTSFYQVGSGAVHSVPWHLEEVLALDARSVSGTSVRINPMSMGGAVDVALAGCGKAIETFGAFWGMDVEDLMVKNATRRRACVVYMENYEKALQEVRTAREVTGRGSVERTQG